jgi:AcrR family transcriptional regulator
MTRETQGPRKKQTRMRGEERRAFILEQAKKVFARQSYSEASTGELASASEVTEPMLYKHFGSKKKLFLALLTSIGEQLTRRFQGQVRKRAEHDLLDALSSLLLDYRAAALADRDSVLVLLHATIDSNDPEVMRLSQEHQQEMYTLVYILLEEAQTKSILPPQLDLVAATWGYLSFLFAIQYRVQLNLTAEFNEQVLKEINRLWLRALIAG